MEKIFFFFQIKSKMSASFLVFDREHGKPSEHLTIHKEYSDLVDALIGCFCDDLGITVCFVVLFCFFFQKFKIFFRVLNLAKR